METQTITYNDWHRTYLAPLIYVHGGLIEPSEQMQTGFAGFVLDGILAVKDIDGEEANDWECVEMVAELVKYAKRLSKRF